MGSHANKLQTFITTQKPSVLSQENVQLQYENHALYQLVDDFIHFSKNQDSIKKFSIGDLKKAIHAKKGFKNIKPASKHSVDSDKFELFINIMDMQQIALQKDMKRWRASMSPQPLGGYIENVISQRKELRISKRKNQSLECEKLSFQKQIKKLQKSLKRTNERASIYKEKLEIIKKIKARKNKLKIVTDQNQNMTMAMDDNKETVH